MNEPGIMEKCLLQNVVFTLHMDPNKKDGMRFRDCLFDVQQRLYALLVQVCRVHMKMCSSRLVLCFCIESFVFNLYCIYFLFDVHQVQFSLVLYTKLVIMSLSSGSSKQYTMCMHMCDLALLAPSSLQQSLSL